MIINVLANGDIKNIVPENIYQGSNKANTIVLIAPFSASVTPTISFELPQTHEIKGAADGYLFNEPTEVSNTVNMWTLQVDEVLTQYYGDVKYQIKFVNTDNEVVAVARGKFKVNEGVDFELPATPSQDVYELLLQNISNIRADFLNGWIEAHGIREYNSEFAYGLGSYVFGVVDNKTMFFRSLIENNKGNALTNTSAWKSIIIGINGVKVNGVEQPTDIDGNVELTVPTKLSELTDDVGIPSKLSELTDDIGVVKSDEENTFRGTQTFTTSILVKTHGKLPYVELGATKLTPTGQNVEVPGIKYTTSDLQVYYLHLPIGGGIVARTKDITNALVDYYTKDEVNNLVSSIPSFDVEVVDNLPTENISEGIIYLVRKGEESPNLFDEYIYVNDKWELLGTQSIATNVTAASVGDVIEDTESIVTMVDGDKLKFELDADLTSKISKSLTVPMDAPSSTELVAVDDGNSQTMVEIGEGLRLENGTLKATGGGATGNFVTTDTYQKITGNKDFVLSSQYTNSKLEVAGDYISISSKRQSQKVVDTNNVFVGDYLTRIGGLNSSFVFSGLEYDAYEHKTKLIGDVEYNGSQLATLSDLEGVSGGGSSVTVVDTLVSQSTTDALSARQGNVLYNMIVDIDNSIKTAIQDTWGASY